jgi:putative endonuclease
VLVAHWLRRAGYDIVAMNLRVGHLELDIVARQGPVIAVVEVRLRGPGAWTTGLGSVDWKKRTRLRRAGERLWQRRYRRDASVDRLRFDVASVSLTAEGPQIEYVVAAF